MDYYQGLDS